MFNPFQKHEKAVGWKRPRRFNCKDPYAPFRSQNSCTKTQTKNWQMGEKKRRRRSFPSFHHSVLKGFHYFVAHDVHGSTNIIFSKLLMRINVTNSQCLDVDYYVRTKLAISGGSVGSLRLVFKPLVFLVLFSELLFYFIWCPEPIDPTRAHTLT